jgi:Uncharacterised nucleotidyltransferase
MAGLFGLPLTAVEGSADHSLDEKVEVVADNLRVDAATADVLRAFEAAGVESLLLKGRSIARWLVYPAASPRAYYDCDLLVPPGQLDLAEIVLGRVGFAKLVDTQGMPDWWREHASVWWRQDDGVLVDLHRTLPGVGVDDEAAWRALSAGTETIPVAGHPAPALALPARALHVVLHAGHHGVEWWRPMADLEYALAQVDEALWRRAGELAERLDATAAFGVGLRLTPAGRELAESLQLPPRRSVEATLRASTPPPVALGFEQLARAGGARRRAEIVWRKFVPPAGFMRNWHPIASRGRSGLLLAYLYRPVWILRRAPRALRAWRRARREASEG